MRSDSPKRKIKPSPYSVCKVVWPILSECSWWKKLKNSGVMVENVPISQSDAQCWIIFFFCILWHLFFTEGPTVNRRSKEMPNVVTLSRCNVFFFPFRFLTLTFLTAVQFAFPCIDWVAVEAIYWSLVISTNVESNDQTLCCVESRLLEQFWSWQLCWKTLP